jgi:hypothetical protein
MRIFFAIVLLLVAPAMSWACSCSEPDGSIEEQVAALYESSEIVGIFEVAGQSFGTKEFGERSERGRWLELEPIRLFKGSNETIFARAAPILFRSSCDVRYRKRHLVLVYAASNSPVPLSWCAPSGSIIRRLEHLSVLLGLSESPQ